jgi:catechol 2,3-dioxygenase-like lactoylglutathione lyase family enzyme
MLTSGLIRLIENEKKFVLHIYPAASFSGSGKVFYSANFRDQEFLHVMTKNILAAIPVLHISDSRSAEDFYCGKLGFTVQWDYRPASPKSDPAYLGLDRDGVGIHLSSFPGDGVYGSVAAFYVNGVDALFAEFAARKVTIGLEPCDQSWGNREMYVRDPDGNSLRFIQPK